MKKIGQFLPAILGCVTAAVVSGYISYENGYTHAMSEVRDERIVADMAAMSERHEGVLKAFREWKQSTYFGDIANSADLIDVPISAEASLDGEAITSKAIVLSAPEVEGFAILCMRDQAGNIFSTPVSVAEGNAMALLRVEKEVADAALVASFNACAKADIMINI